jgi:hypothetical protein
LLSTLHSAISCPLRSDGSTPYRAPWVDLSLPSVGRIRPSMGPLVASTDAQGRRQILDVAHAICDTRLRAEVLHEIAELDLV